MAMKRRTRPLPFGGGTSRGKYVRTRKSTGVETVLGQASTASTRYIGDQITDSENHDWPPPKGSNQDVGGEFTSVRRKGYKPWTIVKQNTQWDDATFVYKLDERNAYSCPIETTASGKPKWPTLPTSFTSSLNAAGATAISRCRPTESGVELSVALGELRKDGLPAVPGVQAAERKVNEVRYLPGDEYLNIQFGWAPMISDVKKLRDTVANYRDILEQYDADRGRLIRRSYTFPTETQTDTVVLSTAKSPDGGALGVTVPGSPGKLGVWSKTTTTTTRRWFKGAFVYGVPQGSTPFAEARRLGAEADRLFGVSLTPDVLWNLTPWSWATDWVFNTGDVLSTVGDYVSQGLVMRYGYMMEEVICQVVYSLSECRVNGKSVSVPDAKLTVSSKNRIRANPFGFGITWDGLSSSQTAILAALGISRR